MNTQVQPLVYVILVTWNHWSATEACLAQFPALDYSNLHVVVVDNGSTDGTPTRLQRLYPSITLLCNQDNLGFAVACNMGLRYALDQGADYLFILNNDTLLPPGVVSQLIAAMRSMPQAGILTPLARYLEKPGVICPTAGFRHWLTGDYVQFYPDLKEKQPVAVDYVFGTAMFVRREVLEQIGLFDERYFMYYEDMDLCLRAARAGFQCFIVPVASILHQFEASTQEDPLLRHYFKARSSVLFFQAHSNGLRRPVVVVYRLGVAVKRLINLIWMGQINSARGYLQGLWDGWRYGRRGYAASSVQPMRR